jgi:putative thioredoxin
MGAHTIDVGLADFQRQVLDESMTRPVLVDFWAPWCGPCQSLKPILEKLAGEYQGRFLLAKVNADENQELSARFGVRGIPAVKAFVGGQPVDEFSGALPESSVRAFLDRIVPGPAEELRRAALALLDAGDAPGALHKLAEAAKLDPADEAIRVDTAAILLDRNETDAAARLLAGLSPDSARQPRVAQLLSRLQFVAEGAGADADLLHERIAANPGDLDARLALAKLLAARQDHAAALEQALEIVRRDRDWNEAAGRKTMLAIFNLLGGQGELVARYRRLLAGALN